MLSAPLTYQGPKWRPIQLCTLPRQTSGLVGSHIHLSNARDLPFSAKPEVELMLTWRGKGCKEYSHGRLVTWVYMLAGMMFQVVEMLGAMPGCME